MVLTDNEKKVIQLKKETHSADSQQSVYTQQQTNDISVVNVFLIFFY